MAKSKSEQKKKKPLNEMEDIHVGFVENLDATRLFVSNLAPVVKKHDIDSTERDKAIFRELDRIYDRAERRSKKGGKRQRTTELTPEEEEQVTRLFRDVGSMGEGQSELLYKSSFVMLISYFDFLIADLVHYYYQKYPGSLTGRDIGIKLAELRMFDDLDDAIEFVLDKEIDSILYGNLESQKNYFKNILKIDLNDEAINWSKINEAIERRNIIVHNKSLVNRRYLKNVDPSLLIRGKKSLKEGDTVGVNERYFSDVIDEIFIAGSILIQLCWRKWSKDSIEDADGTLVQDIYDSLSKSKWALAERLGIFSRRCDVSSSEVRLYLDINYCQSLKWQNKKVTLAQELKKFDVSTLSPLYLLAIAALKSDRKSFYRHLKKAIIVHKDRLDRQAFTEWPLFREMRADPNYEDKIQKTLASVADED